jgi:hypothetical protein
LVQAHGSQSSSTISHEQIEDEISGSENFRVLRTRQEGGVKPRNYYRIGGCSTPTWDIPNNDIDSVAHAILERVFFVKNGKGGFKRAPKPWDHPTVRDLKYPVKEAARKIENRLATFNSAMSTLSNENGKVSPITDEEFLSYYGGAKRKCYEAAIESLKDKPLEARDCKVKVFTKDEYRKPGGAPRAIQPRSPRFNVKLGRYIKHLEHKIFNAIDKIFDPSGEHRTVAKGMNMNERGDIIAGMWNKFDQPIAVGLDASRFDQHINRLLLQHEHRIYHMWSQGKGEDLPNLNTLLRKQIINQGTYRSKDGHIKYKVNGCRMSGDMNTSLGNVIIMCSLMHGYFESKNLLKNVLLLNDGDDCVIIMDKRNLDKFCDGLVEWFLEMGLTMEFDGIYKTLEEVEFCQSRPIKMNDGTYRLIPRPSKRLYSDLITTKDISIRKIYRKQIGAIAGCGLAASSGVPIFQSFYKWLGRGATPWVPSVGSVYHKFRQELVENMEVKEREPTLDERISFYFSFDITPQEQILLEDYYSSLPDPIHTHPDKLFRPLDSVQYLAAPEQKEHK